MRAIAATKNIKRGEEFLTDYGYELGSHVPQWYSALYKTETGNDWYSHKRKKQRQQHPSSNDVKKHQQHKQCAWGK